MKNLRSSIPSRSAILGLAITLLASGCVPKQDPNDPDQCPDINYSLTALKDANLIGSFPLIDDEVQARIAGKFPGCAIAIVDSGKVVYTKGYGFADLNSLEFEFDNVAFTKDTVAGIGSVSKVLTAIATMRLVELGLVNLDSPITTYFPHAVPAGWGQVSVRQLMSHRGGFERHPNQNLAGSLSAAQIDAAFGEVHSSQHPRYAIWEFLLTSRGAPDVDKIGQYSYSNIGYTILGALVDLVSRDHGFPVEKTGYERFIWSLLSGAKDAALTPALNHPWRNSDIPNLAQSYKDANVEVNSNYSGWQGPSGGWSMTIGDLARVLIALQENQILSAQSLAAMRTNPGSPSSADYGLGLFLENKCDLPAYHHGGLIDGFRTQVIVWPGEDVAVAAFVNRDASGVNAIAEAIGKIYMENRSMRMEFSEEDQRFMSSSTYQVAKLYFPALELPLRRLNRNLGTPIVANTLAYIFGNHSSTGREMVDLIRSGEGSVEGVASKFLTLMGQLSATH